MSKPQIISEVPLTLAELKDEVAAIKKRDKELGFRAEKTDEYLQTFGKLDSAKAKDVYKKIDNLKIPRLRDIHMVKIIDVMPKTLDDLKVVLLGYTLTINNTNLKKIVDVINDTVK